MRDILKLVGQVARVGSDVAQFSKAILEVKKALASGEGQASSRQPAGQAASPMQPFRPVMGDPFGGGNQWLPQLSQVAAQFGDSWVPETTEGIGGVDLTGVWGPPNNPIDRTYFRQYGPYVNLIIGVSGPPVGFGEGVFNPADGSIVTHGSYVNGTPFQAYTHLTPDWTMTGELHTVNPMFGMPVRLPLMMRRMA